MYTTRSFSLYVLRTSLGVDQCALVSGVRLLYITRLSIFQRLIVGIFSKAIYHEQLLRVKFG